MLMIVAKVVTNRAGAFYCQEARVKVHRGEASIMSLGLCARNDK